MSLWRRAQHFCGFAGRYVICAIASTGVRNASSISTATPSPVIRQFGLQVHDQTLDGKNGRMGTPEGPKSKDGQSFWQCAMGNTT